MLCYSNLLRTITRRRWPAARQYTSRICSPWSPSSRAATIAAIPAVHTTTQEPPPTQPPCLSHRQRMALISHLGNIDLRSTDKLVLTSRQRRAIAGELEY